LRQKTAKEWLELCDAHDVPVDLCVTPGDAAELEQIRARKDVASVGGDRFATFPVFADGARGGELRRGVPRLGEHTREILVELKFDDAEIAQMVSSGSVKIG
jgi:crotonobetainyl-CoA:carnitine CoA-transferase CaiB-like acyl-CoA transferase